MNNIEKERYLLYCRTASKSKGRRIFCLHLCYSQVSAVGKLKIPLDTWALYKPKKELLSGQFEVDPNLGSVGVLLLLTFCTRTRSPEKQKTIWR